MDGGAVLNSFTPVANSLDRVADVMPNANAPKATSDQVADVIDARDTKHAIRSARQTPMWQRVLSHAATGAAVGGLGLGLKSGVILGRLNGHPLASALGGAGVGALAGAGTGIATELFDRASERRRDRLATETLDKANPSIVKRLKDPDVREPAQDYAESRRAPVQGAELGALLGGVAGGAIGSYSGGPGADHWSRAASGSIMGMAGLGAAGLLAGALWKRHQRKKLVSSLLTEKDASVWLEDNDVKMKTPTGGNPVKASNKRLIAARAETPESYSAGLRIHNAPKLAELHMPTLAEVAAFHRELKEVLGQKTATDAPKLRSRSEVCIYSKKGILGIKKDGYLLMPGGGIDDGETPEFGAYRETIEEADRKLLHLQQIGTSECIWPEDVKLVKGFDGSKTFHFIALDGGKLGTKHEDNEPFKFIPFSTALSFLDECMERDDQKSAKDQNEGRRKCIEAAWDKVKAGDTTAEKLAGVELNVPQQQTSYTCGPCCVRGILDYLDLDIPDDLEEQLETTKTKGTKPEKMVEVLRDLGVDIGANEGWSQDGLLDVLREGEPVLMLIQSLDDDDSDSEDHYVVAVGADGDHLHVSDPATGERRTIPLEEAASEGGLCWGSSSVAKTERWAGRIRGVLRAEKTADALNLIDRPEHVLFNQQGQILVAPDQNKRFKLPTAGAGIPAAYEPAQRLLPPEGVPEAGAHGYNVRLHVGDADGTEVLDGGQWMDPHAVLKSMYGSMGLKVNAHHRDLDRARARVIMRGLKKRKPPAPVAAAAVP